MDSGRSTRSKSKKLQISHSKPLPSPSMASSDPLQFTPQKPNKRPNLDSKNQSPGLVSKTPVKQPPLFANRARNRGVALSIKDTRKAASTKKLISSPSFEPPPPVSSTENPIVTPKKSSKKSSIKLPQSFEMLCDFFNGLDSAIRLSMMKGLMCTFVNISPQVERLTDRRFSYTHLAQLKHIMPNVIEVKRVQVFDERSSCMKPDLHITINSKAIEFEVKSRSESKNLNLRELFRIRLEDFHKENPEVKEVPEEDLPEPFSRSKLAFDSNVVKAPASNHFRTPSMSFSNKSESSEDKDQLRVVPSHLSTSFRKHFSHKLKSTAEIDSLKSSATDSDTLAHATLNQPSATPMKGKESVKVEGILPSKVDTMKSTPAKPTPATPTTATPALKPLKRCYMSPNDDSSSMPNKLVRRRSLRFDTPVKSRNVDKVHEMVDDSVNEVCSILPDNLLQSIREKEMKAMEEQDPAISQAKKRKKIISCLPKLFNMIHYLFQSINRSVITKEELMHRIITGHSAIVDRSEVEEQLELLLELIPEWISEKLASSGDLLVCINKMSSPETMRLRLQEAT